MTIQADKREAIKRKIRALLAQSQSNGATEAEAMAFAAKASELMEEYGLTYESIEDIKNERWGGRHAHVNPHTKKRGKRHEVRWCAFHIAQLFDCVCWETQETRTYFGTDIDTLQAHSLTDMVCLAMEAEWAAYNRNGHGAYAHPKSIRFSFLRAMAFRICERLKAMVAQRDASTTKTAHAQGRALMIIPKRDEVKNQLEKYQDQTNLKLRREVKNKTTIKDRQAAKAGLAAGDRVSLNKQMTTETEKLRLSA